MILATVSEISLQMYNVPYAMKPWVTLKNVLVLRSACLHVGTDAYLRTVRGRDSVLVWWRCDALVLPVLWMTSRMFAHNDQK